MTGIENFWGFLLAGILLNITPGSDTMYILTRTISQGKSAGAFSVLGIGTGSLIHTLFATVGLSAILATSAIAFNIVKYLGVAYLVYLGLKALFSKHENSVNSEEVKADENFKIYREGILTNILNPKVALFFMSFLPQFIDTETAGSFSFLFLGLTFITTGTIWCMFLVFSASFFIEKFRNNSGIEKVMNKLSGFVFISLGVKLATSER